MYFIVVFYNIITKCIKENDWSIIDSTNTVYLFIILHICPSFSLNQY